MLRVLKNDGVGKPYVGDFCSETPILYNVFARVAAEPTAGDRTTKPEVIDGGIA